MREGTSNPSRDIEIARQAGKYSAVRGCGLTARSPGE